MFDQGDDDDDSSNEHLHPASATVPTETTTTTTTTIEIKKYGMRLETPTEDKGWIDSRKSSKLWIRICVIHILVLLNS